MKLQIEEAEVEKERERLVAFLRDNLTPRSDNARFDWLYLNSPFGRGRVWMAFGPTQGLLGVAAAFPRQFYVYGKKSVIWVLGDFCISKSHRSLGPAIQLQKACLQGLRQAGASLGYDFPSRQMQAIYRRISIPESGAVTRFVKPLRFDLEIRAILRRPCLLKFMFRSLCNDWFMARDSRLEESDLEITLMSPLHFGRDFDELDHELISTHEVRGCREEAFLNWRYRDNPLAGFDVFTARNGSRLRGYAVVEKAKSYGLLWDIFGAGASPIRKLLLHISAKLRSEGIAAIHASVVPNSQTQDAFAAAGLHGRDDNPVTLLDLSQDPPLSLNHQLKSWHLTQGDRDS